MEKVKGSQAEQSSDLLHANMRDIFHEIYANFFQTFIDVKSERFLINRRAY